MTLLFKFIDDDVYCNNFPTQMKRALFLLHFCLRKQNQGPLLATVTRPLPRLLRDEHE